MAGIARAMKRHGLTTKPMLRLENTVRSGDTDYYMFEMSGTGRHYTIAKHDFWRGAHRDQFPEADLRPLLADLGVEKQEIESAIATTDLILHANEPAAPGPEPAPAATSPAVHPLFEQVTVRDLAIGDVVNLLPTPTGKPREIVRVVPGAPTYTVHYVFEGTAALRTAKHFPGMKLILRKRASA